jgi:hypothetical protein
MAAKSWSVLSSSAPAVMHVWAMIQSIGPRRVPRPHDVAIGAKALQHLGQDHGDQAGVLTVQGLRQPINLRRVSAVEPVGPDRRVDDDHWRERRHESMSPSQGILPLSFRSAR